jgi:hypothetical protein
MTKSKDNTVIAPKRRRLSDLFVVGEELEFDDGIGEPIKIWVQKLTNGETQQAVEASRPAKTKITAIKRLPDDHPAKLRYLDELESEGFDTQETLIDYLIQNKLEEERYSAEARIGAEDEWAKDDYLIGLQDAWNSELEEIWIKGEKEDEEKFKEADRVYKELRKFTDQVDREVEAARQELIYEYDDFSLEALQRKAVNKLIDDHGDNALLAAFRKQQLFYATRDGDNHSRRYFESVNEIDTLPTKIHSKLLLTYLEISVDGMEGKD